jgi:hypothetical protein
MVQPSTFDTFLALLALCSYVADINIDVSAFFPCARYDSMRLADDNSRGSLSQMSVTAEGAYFSKGIQTVIKAEDPEYLDVVDYFVNLEGRLMLMRDNVARLSRAYMSLGALWGECPPVSTGTRG